MADTRKALHSARLASAALTATDSSHIRTTGEENVNSYHATLMGLDPNNVSTFPLLSLPFILCVKPLEGKKSV
jgi:mevalonate pyrophosphate decarboxylase